VATLTCLDTMTDYGQCVFVANGRLEAQQVQSFLAAEGISSTFRGESLSLTHGLSLDGLGRVEVMVDEADAERARELLASAQSGNLRLDEDTDVTRSDPDA
jgi:putative signal transducing protein